MHRRSSEDKEWQKTKEAVDKRDHRECRWKAILTTSEVAKLKLLYPMPSMLQQIDHAHVLPVGNYVTLTYDIDNVYCLCRWAHNHIDNLINPLTNLSMTQNEQWYWWWRIRYKKTDEYDSTKNYEELYNKYIDISKEKKSIMEWW